MPTMNHRPAHCPTVAGYFAEQVQSWRASILGKPIAHAIEAHPLAHAGRSLASATAINAIERETARAPGNNALPRHGAQHSL